MRSFDVALLRDDVAHALLADQAFLQAWRKLLSRSPRATVYQSPEFVRTWYRIYREDWRPVLVLARDSTHALRGLWTLAYHSRGRVLVQAGAVQAEYQTWLSSPTDEISFVRSALRRLWQAYDHQTLRIRYLQPADDLANGVDPISDVPGAFLRQHTRPIVDLRRGKWRTDRPSRLRRLQALGTLRFALVTEPGEFDALFDQLIDNYDLRMGALYDVVPFRVDPLKREFHRAMFIEAPAQSHFSALLLDGRLAGASWGQVTGNTFHLGLLTHDATYGALSPGARHMVALCTALRDQGFERLDLTPGNDSWKYRLGTYVETVSEVVFHRRQVRSWIAKLDAAVGAAARAAIARLGMSPSGVRHKIAIARRATPPRIARHVWRWARFDRALEVYRVDRAQADRYATDPRIRRNCLADLVAYGEDPSWQSRQSFLSKAIDRLAAGECCYTVTVDGRLAHVCWLAPRQSASRISEVCQSIELPPGSCSLYDSYTAPAYRGRGLFQSTMCHILNDVFRDPSVAYAYCGVLVDNHASRNAILATGFVLQGSLTYRRRFGAEQRSRTGALGAPPT